MLETVHNSFAGVGGALKFVVWSSCVCFMCEELREWGYVVYVLYSSFRSRTVSSWLSDLGYGTVNVSCSSLVSIVLDSYKPVEMRWDEMRWDEMRWDEMRWDEMRWDEMRWDGMWCDVMWCDGPYAPESLAVEQRVRGIANYQLPRVKNRDFGIIQAFNVDSYISAFICLSSLKIH